MYYLLPSETNSNDLKLITVEIVTSDDKRLVNPPAVHIQPSSKNQYLLIITLIFLKAHELFGRAFAKHFCAYFLRPKPSCA